MAGTWVAAPSPCVGVCKFREGGQCIGCAMTRPEKKRFKRLRGKAGRRPFFESLVARLRAGGRLDYWQRMYRRKCDRKGRPCPLDKLGIEPPA